MNGITRKSWLRASFFSVVMFISFFGFAIAGEEPVWIKKNVFGREVWDYAIGGFDTVSYHEAGGPVLGKPEFTTEYKGVKWVFTTEENINKFKKEPDKYRPQYGGHCAWALAAKNQLVHGDPEVWKIVDGRLYLNFSTGVQDMWEEDIKGNIEKADSNWSALIMR